MNPLSPFIITPLAALTVLGQVISVFLILVLIISITNAKLSWVKKVKTLIDQNYVPIVLLISGIATLGSLSFSEILGFIPCKLCWYQRILMYPQFVISLIALFTNDLKIKKYILSFSIMGFLVGVYHIMVQMFPEALECSDEVAKCSFKEFATFGYVTIPVMSVTAFLMLILISLVKSKTSKK